MIVQLRRYRRQRRYLGEQDQPHNTVDPEAAFKTGGCCSCCVEEDEDRCCCCRCACCEPEGIMASYILGDEMEGMEIEVGEEMEEEKEKGCCCCGKQKEDEVISLPQSERVPIEAHPQPIPQPHQLQQLSQTHQLQQPPQTHQPSQSQQPPQPVQQLPQTQPVPQQLPQTHQHPIIILSPAPQPIQQASQSPLPSPLSQQSQQFHNTTSIQTAQTPIISALQNVHLIEAVAEDGSGKKVYIAVPNVQ